MSEPIQTETQEIPTEDQPTEENPQLEEAQPREITESKVISPSTSTTDLTKMTTTPAKKKTVRRKKKSNKAKIQIKARYLEMSAKEKASRARKPVKHRLVGLLDGESKFYSLKQKIYKNRDF